jgi:hypothetical protein
MNSPDPSGPRFFSEPSILEMTAASTGPLVLTMPQKPHIPISTHSRVDSQKGPLGNVQRRRLVPGAAAVALLDFSFVVQQTNNLTTPHAVTEEDVCLAPACSAGQTLRMLHRA